MSMSSLPRSWTKGYRFLDQSKLPPEQKVNYGELLKTTGKVAPRSKLTSEIGQCAETDVIKEIGNWPGVRLQVDEFVKEVDAAKNHDDLKGAVDKIEGTLTEEHPKKFLGKNRRRYKRDARGGIPGSAQEAVTLLKDAIGFKRLQARISTQPDFALTLTDAELEGIITKGKELVFLTRRSRDCFT